MGLLSSLRSLVTESPATRRLRAQHAEAFSSEARPSRALARSASTSLEPFGGGMGGPPARNPPIEWMTGEDIPPSPQRYVFTPGYSDHTYQNYAAPLAFEGWSIDRIRAAVALHRIGVFWESSALMVALLGFAPVLAALQQAIAPILALKRHIHGGDKGLAKMIAAEVEEALVPRVGLEPSIYLPPEEWGTMAIYFRFFGFFVLQHVDGDMDPVTKVRPRFTRVWDPWAVGCYRSPRKRLAYTEAGTVDIVNDGKFTWVADEREGHLSGAIVALGEETFGGKFTQEARLNWLDFFGSPKLYATLPEKVPTHGEAGDAFLMSVERIYGPDGRGILPYGAKLDAVSISGEGAKAFSDAGLDAIVRIFMVLTGSAGTIGNGMNTGAGQTYQPAKGGSWGVRHDLIARPTIAICRGINQGHIAPYVDINYGDEVEGAKRAGTWKEPVMDIPLPAPDRDDRIESVTKREAARTDIIKSRRDNGILVDQEEADKIADDLELRHVPLADKEETPAARLELAPTDVAKVVRVDEARRSQGLPPIGDERGALTIAEMDAAAKAASQTAPAAEPSEAAQDAAGAPPPEDEATT